MDLRVKMLIASMKDNLDHKVSVDELAKSANISPSHLHYLFKAETGRSPAHYLRRLRILKAGELLATTQLSIKEILIKVGINDRSHFDRDFKKYYGLTPKQYRMTSMLMASMKQTVKR